VRAAILLALMVTLLACPVLAAAETGEEVGGVPVVTPGEFGAKIQEAGDALYRAASPLADLLGRLSIAGAAVLLVLVLVVGAGVVRRVIGAVFVICLGIALWYLAPVIVEWVKLVAAWFQS